MRFGEQPLSFAAVKRLFSDGRAVWRGRTVSQSGQMYLAAASRGVAGGVAGFERFAIVKRNGLAFSAVLADSVRVAPRDVVELIAGTEDWPLRVVRSSDASGKVQQAARAYEKARVDLARASATRTPELLRRYLAAITRLEISVGQSSRVRDALVPRSTPLHSGAILVDLLDHPTLNALRGDAAFRIAVGLASIRTAPISGSSQLRV